MYAAFAAHSALQTQPTLAKEKAGTLSGFFFG